MESIDRLRRYVTGPAKCGISHICEKNILKDLDSIEREVEDNERFRREAEPFHDRLCRASERREDVTLFGEDYMPCPLDADGEPIHVGDVMENIVCPPVHREVTGVGAECFYGWDVGNGRYSQFGANCYRHHHKPTVEDVLREFVDALDIDRCDDPDATIAEFAAKLALRGDE